MEEGYVSAHSYPERPSSVGVKILLWSKLGKQDDVLRSLLGTLGIDEGSYSLYRVIHGGVNGLKNWKEEANAIGPAMRNTRECDPEIQPADTKGNKVSTEQYASE
jgi:hypothetical protein